MQRRTFVLGLVVVAIQLACSEPVEPTDDPANIMGEAMVSADLTLHHRNSSTSTSVSDSESLPRKPSSKGEEGSQKASRETGNSGQQPSTEELENDYSFLADKMPDLPDDEYLEIGEDNTPFNYLKNSEKKRDATKAPVRKEAAALGGGNPIYITVPIYINTAGVLPLKLTVGGQEVPLDETPKNDPPKALSPTSQYNRLLHTDGRQTIAGPRQTNRHRSNIRAKKQARKRSTARGAPQYRQLGAYRLRL